MPKLTIYDAKGKKVGTYNVEPTDFAPRINKQLLHDAVVMYQANLRQGSHKTKSRARSRRLDQEDVPPEGHGQRPRRLAAERHPSRRRAHQADPATAITRTRLPRKALQLATRMALAAKVRDDAIVLIDDLAFAAPKTKDMAAILKTLGCDGRVAAGHDRRATSPNVYKQRPQHRRVCRCRRPAT